MSQNLCFILLSGALLVPSGISRAQPGGGFALEIEATFRMDVAEPSGLSLCVCTRHLWTVSDRTNRVYKISLTGEMVDSLRFVGEDLEGVAHDPWDGTLWLVEERRRELVHVDSTGQVLGRTRIPVDGKRANHGLEGIAFDARNHHIFLVNEKSPVLLLELDDDLKATANHPLPFVRDASGLAFDPAGYFWLLSDASRSLSKISLAGVEVARYKTGLEKAEGVALDAGRGILYFVSDKRSELYRCRLKK